MTSLEDLKAIPVLSVASHLGIKVKNNKAMCFTGHDKNTPSLSFKVKENYWKCFGCGKAGSSIDLVKYFFNYNFREAAEWLKREFVILDNTSSSVKKFSRQKQSRKINITSKGNTDVQNSEVYNWIMMNTSLSKNALDYLLSRKLTNNTISENKFTSCDNPVFILSELKKKFTIKELSNAGLVSNESINGNRFVWWQPVILFPFFNTNDKIIYIQARHYLKEVNPKYLNLFNIKKPIYNQQLLNKLKDGDTIYFCEGVIDAITATQFKLNAFGILGAHSFDDSFISNFLKFRIRIIQDNDLAGQKFSLSIQRAFLKAGKSVRIVKIPSQFKDINEYLKESKNE